MRELLYCAVVGVFLDTNHVQGGVSSCASHIAAGCVKILRTG